MGRWRALAGRGQADGDGDRHAGADGPPTMEEFLDANHRLFTLIGVFGGLSVYLMKFQASVSGVSSGPVGAVLLLFLLTSAVAIRNSYRCTERAREHGSYLLVLGYAVFMYSFVTLAVSVVFVILGRYAGGAESVLGSSVVFALLFVYVPFVFRADALLEFEGATPMTVGVRRAPYLSAGLLAAWYAREWHRDALPTLPLDSAAAAIGTVLSLVGNHFVITAVVVGLLWAVDRGVGRVRGMVE